MLKLLVKMGLLTVIVFGICYATFFLNPDFSTNYLASIELKLDKLKKIDTEKIVIIGGSNVCIGINGETIENELEVPVVNMGLHGSLGPKFWLEYVKDEMNPGDVLIMSPEYPMLSKEKWYGMEGTAVPKTILYTPSKLPILFSDYQFFKKTTTGIFRTVKAYWENYPFEQNPFLVKQVYDIRSFEKDNFRSVYLKGNLKKKYGKDTYEFDLEQDAWEELKAYKSYFDKENVQFYISPPSVLNESVKKKNAIAYLESFSEQSNVPVLNNNYEYFFGRNLMFDTNYHLNEEGVVKRTNRLKRDLNQALYQKELKPKSKVLLAKPKFNQLLLDNVNMKHNVKLNRARNDSILVTPLRDQKMGFLMYKTDPTNYIGNLLKIKVRAKPNVLKSLQFRGIKFYDFDYIKTLGNDTYVLCKSLSNVYTNPKDNSFSAIGIGYDFETLNTNQRFTILDMTIVDQDLNCEDVSEYNYSDTYYVPKKVNQLLLEINDFDSDPIQLHEILNIPVNDIVLDNRTKYLIKFNQKQLEFLDFYSEELIFEMEDLQRLVFINSLKFNREIKILY